MTDSLPWTQKLTPTLASALAQGGPWLRVEEARSGGWYCLHGGSGENAIHWHHLSETGELESLDPMSDKRLPALPEMVGRWISEGIPVELLAWRLGSRAIFRLGNQQFAKVFRKDRQVLERWKHLETTAAKHSIQIPQISSWDSQTKTLIVEAAPGESLNSIWKSGKWEDSHIEAILRILRFLGTTTASDQLPDHTVSDEVDILEKRNEVFHRILAEPSNGVNPIVTEVIDRLKQLPPATSVICHRDFHDKQVLVSKDQMTLLDLDLLANSDPALDAGNILAHLRLRSLQGLPVPWEICAREISGLMADLNIEKERLATWTASTFTRLLLIYSRRNRPDELLATLEQDLNELLSDSGKWQGVLS